MNGPLTPREAALKVAVATTFKDAVDEAHKAVRAQAQEVFAGHRKEGNPQQRVLFPDGTDLGVISIRGGSPRVDFTGDDPDPLLAWCEENLPDGIEPYLAEGAAGSREVIALIAAHFPNLVRRRVRTATREALMKQLAETGGFLVNEDGEKADLATVTTDDPTGAFSYRPSAGAKDRIMTVIRDQFRDLVLGEMLALPAPESVSQPRVRGESPAAEGESDG